MNLSDSVKPPSDLMSGRFFLVGYLPTYAAVGFLLTLIWAGAPGSQLDFSRAWQTWAKLGLGQVALLVLAIMLVAVLAAPLQLAMVRVLEGSWPRWLGADVGRWWQLRRKRRLEAAAELPAPATATTDEGGAVVPELLPASLVQQSGAAGSRLRQSFPRLNHLVRPTALGNVLAAMEDTAGRTYGLDAVVAWPRLYPVLGDKMRAIVDDRRDAVDAAARLTVTGSTVAAASAALLIRSGWWLLLAAIPLAVAVLAYIGAVQAALAYGEAVQVAFDLHRFDMLSALHLRLPSDQRTETAANRALCDLWRQDIPIGLAYRHRDSAGTTKLFPKRGPDGRLRAGGPSAFWHARPGKTD